MPSSIPDADVKDRTQARRCRFGSSRRSRRSSPRISRCSATLRRRTSASRRRARCGPRSLSAGRAAPTRSSPRTRARRRSPCRSAARPTWRACPGFRVRRRGGGSRGSGPPPASAPSRRMRSGGPDEAGAGAAAGAVRRGLVRPARRRPRRRAGASDRRGRSGRRARRGWRRRTAAGRPPSRRFFGPNPAHGCGSVKKRMTKHTQAGAPRTWRSRSCTRSACHCRTRPAVTVERSGDTEMLRKFVRADGAPVRVGRPAARGLPGVDDEGGFAANTPKNEGA